MRAPLLWCLLLSAMLGCGSDDTTDSPQPGLDAASEVDAPQPAEGGSDSGKITCTGTHAPCSVYTGDSFATQECLNHGCSINGGACVGTPHTCESLQIQVGAPHTLDCGEGHGCNACPACAAGTQCVQKCLSGGFESDTICVPSSLSCDACSDECRQLLCESNTTCSQSCAVITPGAFQCRGL